jgi:hypothetical protein
MSESMKVVREEPEETPNNVIRIDNKQPYEAPVKTRKKRHKLDPASVVLMEDATAEFLTGELRGAVLIAWNEKDKKFQMDISLPVGEDIQAAAYRYLGALEVMKAELLDIAMYGAPTAEELEQYEDWTG